MSKKPGNSYIDTESQRSLRAPEMAAQAHTAEELLHELQVHQTELDMQNEELRQAQVALEVSRDRYADMYEFAPVGCLTLTCECTISEINLTGTMLLGMDRNKLQHRRFDSFVATEDRECWTGHFLSVLKYHEKQSFDLKLKRGSGAFFYAQLDCISTGSGSESSVRITLTDITARKQAEDALQESKNQLQATFDAIPDMLFEVGLDGRIYNYHPARIDLLAAPSGEFIGKTFADILAPVSTNVCMAALLEANEKGASTGKQYELQLPHGKFWFELSVSRKPVNPGQEPRFIMLSRDITEREQAQRQMSDLSVHFQNVREEEKARIAREIHDDLGGTLTALKMDVYWLAEELSANKQAAQFLKQIESMSQLIDSAVSVTRSVITGLRPTILDDLGLLATLEWQAAQFQQRTGIECKVNCIEDIESKGKQDKRRSIALFRIFQEALTNISRHSGASKVQVEYQHGDDEIMLSISDNGCGLPIDRNAASNTYGILGMTERIGQLGGRIKFDSSPGEGLSVTVILPLAADNRKEERI